MKKLFVIICLTILNFSYGQLPVTDVAANANLVVLNTQIGSVLATLGSIEGTLGSVEGTLGSVEGTGTENSASNAESLTESTSQGETMFEQLDQVEEIQKDLSKVKQAVKDVKEIRQSLIYIVKIIQDTSFILGHINNMSFDGERIFSSTDIDQINNVFDSTLDIVNGLMETIQKLVKDNIFKMEEGNRLQLILNISEKIKKEYTKIHSQRIRFESEFKFILGSPLNNN